jgi:hypothetical protein
MTSAVGFPTLRLARKWELQIVLKEWKWWSDWTDGSIMGY